MRVAAATTKRDDGEALQGGVTRLWADLDNVALSRV